MSTVWTKTLIYLISWRHFKLEIRSSARLSLVLCWHKRPLSYFRVNLLRVPLKGKSKQFNKDFVRQKTQPVYLTLELKTFWEVNFVNFVRDKYCLVPFVLAFCFQNFAVFLRRELDSCIYAVKILFNLNPHGNEKLELFSQRTYEVQNFGNKTLFIAKNSEENNDAWPTNVSQFCQAMW